MLAGAAGATLGWGASVYADAGRESLVAEGLRLDGRLAPAGVDERRPRFGWTLAAGASTRGARQASFRIRVRAGAGPAGRGDGLVWDSGHISSSTTAHRPGADVPLEAQRRYCWSVLAGDERGAGRWSAPQAFTTGVTDSRWRGRWIAASPDGAHDLGPAPAIRHPGAGPAPVMPLFRHAFRAPGRVVEAILCISGLGQYEAWINGRRVGDALLAPGWTDYRRTALYDTYDVSDLLDVGDNVLGVMLGAGMYDVDGVQGRYTKFIGSFGQPKLLAQLRIRLEDGGELWVVSDEGWRIRPGPITFSSIYGGEDFDARRLPADWTRPTASEEGWGAVKLVEGPGGRLSASGAPPIRLARTLKPLRVSEPRPGVFVYDLGENFAGWPRIRVRGPAGATVRLLPGELLDAGGLVSQRSGGGAPGRAVEFNYTLNGAQHEDWRPRFSYYGFRYVQLEGAAPMGRGASGVPEVLALEGEVLHADLPVAGEFDSSDQLFVRIHRLIRQALLSNTMSVLTDCPTREKLGWLEQTHLNAPTVFYNLDAETLYAKMVGDIADSQHADGLVPEIAPEYIDFVFGQNRDFLDSPEWGVAVVLSPWAAYRFYGDAEILRRGYPAMQRYAAYLAAKAPDGWIDWGLGDWYDVGPKPPGPAQLSSKAVTATAVYYEMLAALARIAALVGRGDEADGWAARARAVRDVYNARLFDPTTGAYDRGSQTAQAMPLALGMVPPGREMAVLDRLVAAVRARNDHVSAGDIGFHYVVKALTDHGRDDVLYALMSKTDAPSYGDQLARGATSLTEAWDANPHNSQNHFMLGHAEGWLFGGLAGVRIDMAAESDARITLAPRPVGEIARASATYRSVLGEVESAWARDGGLFRLHVRVPAGVTATVVLPGSGRVREGGRPIALARGVLRVDGRRVVVGSGDYAFETPL
jgi:alpha-L-rhamnosidase